MIKLYQNTAVLLTGLGLLATGCSDDGAPATDEAGASETGTPTTSGADDSTTGDETSGDSSTDAGTTGPGTDSGSDSGSGTTTGEPGPFVFNETDPADYIRRDRAGFPLSNVIANLFRDSAAAYNDRDPSGDTVLADTAPDVADSLRTLHWGSTDSTSADDAVDGLEDDLPILFMAFGSQPPPSCTVPGTDSTRFDPLGTCLPQIAPYIVPDVLRIDLDEPAGFSFSEGTVVDPMLPPFGMTIVANGRMPADVVIEPVLATTMFSLEQTPGGAAILNDTLSIVENDVPFPEEFPYLAPQQTR